MTWIYDQARQTARQAIVTLKEPTTGRSKDLPPFTQGEGESDAAFAARVTPIIDEHLRILNGLLAGERDVTNLLRPGPQAPGDKA